MMKKLLITGILSVALLASCGKKEETTDATAKASTDEAVESTVAMDGTPVTIAGITFTPPTTWIDNGPNGMRKADYSFTAVEGETEDAAMSVFYFGADQGGSVQANIDRWIGQLKVEEGTTPTQSEMTVDGMKVTSVDVSGAYSNSMGGPNSDQKNDNHNFKLFGAVVEGPEGSVFFKLTGPDKTATEMSVGFLSMIKAVKSASSTEL